MIPRCFTFLRTTDNRPSDALNRFFAFMAEATGLTTDGTLADMAAKAQAWATGQLQYQIQEKYGDALTAAMPHFQALGLAGERRPTDDFLTLLRTEPHRNVLVLCGARYKAMSKRLEFALSALPNDIPLWEIVGLGSIRRLDVDELEDWEKARPPHLPRDWRYPSIEADLCYAIVQSLPPVSARTGMTQHTRVCAPPRLRPKQQSPAEAAAWRPEPGFRDTLQAWKALRASEVSSDFADLRLIVVTSGPVWDRYEYDIAREFPGVHAQVIGYATPATLNCSQYLNELALQLREAVAM